MNEKLQKIGVNYKGAVKVESEYMAGSKSVNF